MLVFKDVFDEEMIKGFLESNKVMKEFDPEGLYYGAFEKEMLIGIAQILLEGDKVYLHYLYLEEKYRGQGIGITLVKALFNKLELMGYKTVYSKAKDEYLDKIGFTEINHEYQCDINSIFSFGSSCCKE